MCVVDEEVLVTLGERVSSFFSGRSPSSEKTKNFVIVQDSIPYCGSGKVSTELCGPHTCIYRLSPLVVQRVTSTMAAPLVAGSRSSVFHLAKMLFVFPEAGLHQIPNSISSVFDDPRKGQEDHRLFHRPVTG